MYKQDLHIHTTFSTNDKAIVPQQTLAFIAWLKHAEVIGISDHFEYIKGNKFEEYRENVKKYNFYCGTEVNGYKEAEKAVDYDFDYFFYHCRDRAKDYLGVARLLSTGKPVIISHPNSMGTDLSKLPSNCYIEINNRYIWLSDWKKELGKYKDRFRFVLSSDAHQPGWLNQEVAIKVAQELGIQETIVF